MGDSAPPSRLYCDTLSEYKVFDTWLIAYALLPCGLTATSTALGPVATVAGFRGDSAPPAPTLYCATAPPVMATYTFLPSGLTAIPAGKRSVATVGGLLGNSTPPAPTSYCEMVSEPLVTYTL